jgi:hypothetical protein
LIFVKMLMAAWILNHSRPHSLSMPESISIPWGRGRYINSRLSFTPLMLPGRFIIKVFFLIPLTPLERMALGVFFCPLILTISQNPGTFLSITLSVASGVTSLGESPVPPVVTTRSAFPLSEILISFLQSYPSHPELSHNRRSSILFI